MNRKVLPTLYSVIFCVLILLPLVFTNNKPNQNSFFDNQPLPEFPAKWSRSYFSDLENYFNFRLGFREPGISAYQLLNDRLFGLMEHPTYMRGSNNYLYFKAKNYTNDYQNIHINETYLEQLVAFLERLESLSKEYDTDFIFVALPDKKSIYPEFFPRGYNIKDTPGKMDLLKQKLENTNLDYLFLKDAFLQKKLEQQIYNVEYDAGHWNGNGEYYGVSLMITHLHDKDTRVPLLNIDDYLVSTEVMKTLPVSHFPIQEEVPKYTLKASTAVNDLETLNADPQVLQNRGRYRLLNPEAPHNLKLLVIGDSYMTRSSKFFSEQFQEVTFLHTANLPLIRSHLETYRPDFFILEAVERVIGGSNAQMLTEEVINMQEFPLTMK
ncbi:MAG: hypothetical protein ACOX7B_07800 [Christensenellales bacterium]